METYVYKRVGDVAIRADVYGGERGGRSRPVVVWIHGGALISGSRHRLPDYLFDRLIREGVIVVSIDYRLAPETKLPDIMTDIDDAFAWIREDGPALFGVDPGRIGVHGASAGGYLALMCGFRVKPRPQVVAAFAGYGDIAGDWYAEPDPGYCRRPMVPEEEARGNVGRGIPTGDVEGQDRAKYYLFLRQRGLWPEEVVGFDPHDEAEAFRPYCPVQNVTASYPPAVLYHGTADHDVPFEESARMADALTGAGVPHLFLPLAGVDHVHAGAEPEEFQRVVDMTASFMLSYLK